MRSSLKETLVIDISFGRGAVAALRKGLTCARAMQAPITKVIATRAHMTEAMLLDAAEINKSFAGVQALRDVSFGLRAGEVHALIGENGAGKSTLIKIVTGAVTADSGSIKVAGEAVTHNSPAVARCLSIAVIYQQPALFPDLTVS